jgi:transcriptional regulator with XRE-family HTH domain
MNELQLFLKNLMVDRKCTYAEIEAKTGVTRHTLMNITHGKNGSSIITANAILKPYGKKMGVVDDE